MINISKQISSEKSFKTINNNYQYADMYGKLLGKRKTKDSVFLVGDRSVLVLSDNTEITTSQYSQKFMTQAEKKFWGIVDEKLTYQEAKELYRMFSQRMIKEDLPWDVMLKVGADIRGLEKYMTEITK